MRVQTAVLCTVAQLLFFLHLSASKSKHVAVNLNAKWPSTPVILEASEYLAKEGNDLFWGFVNSLSEIPQSNVTEVTDEERYRLVMQLARPLLSPLQMSLFKFALSTRAHSPSIEMYNQIALDKNPPGDCEVFIDVNNMVTCEPGAFQAFLSVAKDQAKPALVKNDHHYPGSSEHSITVILYAELGTAAFTQWHSMLRAKAEHGEINYILRHYIKVTSDRKVRLSGYGVELAIKSTEYKAKDDTKVGGDNNKDVQEEDEDEVQGFLFTKLGKLYPALKENLGEFRQHLVDSTEDLAPLKVWQLQDLSFQAAQRVFNAPQDDKLRLLRDLSQNFPSMARSLVKVNVKDEVREEIKNNQGVLEAKFGISPGESVMFINGQQADLEIYDVFQLLESMRSEARLMEGLHSLAAQYEVDSGQLMQMLKVDLRDKDTNYAVDIRDDAVLYINNLESDKKYSSWPGSVQELLRPSFPGMLKHVRKNLFHLVFMVNPAEKKYKELLKMAEAFYVHNAPVRIGLVLVVNPDPEVDGTQDAGVAMFRAFNYIRQSLGAIKALSFLTDIYDRVDTGEITPDFLMQEFAVDYVEDREIFTERDSQYDEQRAVYDRLRDDAITPEAVIKELEQSVPDSKDERSEVFGEESEYDQGRQETAEFFERTGLGELPQVLLNGAPMKREEMDDEEFEEAAVTGILKQTPDIQRAVYNGELKDGMDMLDFLMAGDNVMPRLNSRVLTAGTKNLDLTKEVAAEESEDTEAFCSLSPPAMTASIAASLHYLTKKEEVVLRPTTVWVVADLETTQGRQLVYDAIKHLKHASDVRVGLIHNPAVLPGQEELTDHLISKAAHAAIQTLSSTMAKSYVTKLMKEDHVEALSSGSKTLEDLSVHNMDMVAYREALSSQPDTFLKKHRTFCDKVLEFSPAQRGIVCNGKVIGPLKDEERFTLEDFNLLQKYTSKSVTSKISEKIKETGVTTDRDRGSELAMKVAALLTSVSQKESRKEVPFYDEKHSVVTLAPKDPSLPAYDVVAVMDPTSRAAQKYTPLIMVLQEVTNVNVRVFMNCREKLSDMPLKSYYRYVLEPELSFEEDGSILPGPYAWFQDMPLKPLLTLGMDPPESWLVEVVIAPYDLDNIYLEEVDTGVEADFELEYLLLEGHCYDSSSGQPPRGLQFILGTNTTHDMVDTIVMANLGYFQLKATPGAWILRLRPGRSNEIYDITSHSYTDSPTGSSEVLVVIDSFTSKIIRLQVQKKKGQESEDLLVAKEPQKGIWDSISSKLTGGTASEQKEQTINIFSVASGHLYERFLRIMMLSVLKHTQTKVKFWFLKNFLSPTFKDFIPHMAKKYNFEYELVQYKWPRWLHQQTEKQRIIWGYKILFLDVLFPLNVDKFIFVDADQIVRTDLQELVDFDLEGAPYGYTPFCDSRKEMDGFRFWKSGYWASHLAGRKYHISALYVVDLKKFRKIAAGDRLRGQYQGLSQDPNSLSNLDQDLPNNMLHQVPIKSLPQDWLWCETWCSDSGLATAKTIDLCNNPRTKEPKLTAAVRIVAEWKDYDTEVKQLWDNFYKNKSIDETSDSSTDSPQESAKDKGKEEL